MAGDQKGDRFQRIISQRLAASRVAGDAHCPDASIIAAYRERSLARDERAQCERHIAQCARCGGALAALARIDDAVEPGSTAHTQAARDDSRAWWRVRGPLPLAGFAGLAAILIVVALRTFTAQRGLIDGERRTDLQAKSLASNAASAAAKPIGGAALGNSVIAMNEAARAKPESSPLQKSVAPKVRPPPKEAGSLARQQARTLSRDGLKERDKLKEKDGRNRESDKPKAESAGAPIGAIATAEAPAPATPYSSAVSAPIAAPAAAADAAIPAPAPANGGSAAGAGAAASIAAPATSFAARRAGAGAPMGAGTGAIGGNGSALSAPAAGVAGSISGANAILVEPPDHAAAWTVGAHGAISRYSPTTGWVPQSSGVTADLTGGSAPSAATCWIVGRAGTIVRTVDGAHWTTVVAPVREDLTGVVASSANSATISAASGRRFATSDGGAIWRPLQ